MGNLTEWHSRAVCPHCGWHTYAPFASLFHVHRTCCPLCGTEKDDTWNVKTMRRIENSNPRMVWYNPFTWLSRNIVAWETKN